MSEENLPRIGQTWQEIVAESRKPKPEPEPKAKTKPAKKPK